MKAIKVLFTERITGIGSWNGKYTGSIEPCYTVLTIEDYNKISWFKDACGESNSKTFYYNFGDGYSSSCTISVISNIEAKKIYKKDAPLCRPFFVDEILHFGEIRELSVRRKMEKEERIKNASFELLGMLKELRTHVKFKSLPELQINCPKAKLINKVDKVLKDLL